MTKTMIKTMSTTVATALAATMLLATNASADTKALAYCDALVQTYERQLNIGSAKSRAPQSLETHHAAEQCKAGDIRGISALERALENAKIPLPSRG
jgi:hypothetical protein